MWPESVGGGIDGQDRGGARSLVEMPVLVTPLLIDTQNAVSNRRCSAPHLRNELGQPLLVIGMNQG